MKSKRKGLMDNPVAQVIVRTDDWETEGNVDVLNTRIIPQVGDHLSFPGTPVYRVREQHMGAFGEGFERPWVIWLLVDEVP